MMRCTRLPVLGLSLLATATFAHTELSSSMPADQATVMTTPDKLELAFSEAVRLTALSLTDAAGKGYELGALPTATQREFALSMPALPTGSYSVGWRAVGADTHVVSGEIHFSIAAH